MVEIDDGFAHWLGGDARATFAFLASHQPPQPPSHYLAFKPQRSHIPHSNLSRLRAVDIQLSPDWLARTSGNRKSRCCYAAMNASS